MGQFAAIFGGGYGGGINGLTNGLASLGLNLVPNTPALPTIKWHDPATLTASNDPNFFVLPDQAPKPFNINGTPDEILSGLQEWFSYLQGLQDFPAGNSLRKKADGNFYDLKDMFSEMPKWDQSIGNVNTLYSKELTAKGGVRFKWSIPNPSGLITGKNVSGFNKHYEYKGHSIASISARYNKTKSTLQIMLNENQSLGGHPNLTITIYGKESIQNLGPDLLRFFEERIKLRR